MSDATGTNAQVRLTGVSSEPEGVAREVEFSASGKVIQFPGYLRAYVEGEDDPEAELADREVVLPALAVGDVVEGSAFDPGSHATQPPARYTEASLVKAMEELGVGRPSTYASVIATILDRGYVWKKGTALVPSFTAFAVVGLLERYFSELVDYGFTASMEDDLDAIASGDEEALPWLTRFYFGTPGPGNGNGNGNGSHVGGGGGGDDGSGRFSLFRNPAAVSTTRTIPTALSSQCYFPTPRRSGTLCNRPDGPEPHWHRATMACASSTRHRNCGPDAPIRFNELTRDYPPYPFR